MENKFKSLSKKLFEIEVINIRDFSDNKSNSVDEKPFGGGAGMIIKPDVMQNALDYATKDNIKNKKIIFLSPGGQTVNTDVVNELVTFDELVIICGRYEGIDERFLKYNAIEEYSIGDFILSGGEIPSIILIDTCVRLIPEVLGNKNSLKFESFQNHLLEYPQYTKPSNWKGLSVPDVLLSGNHKKISDWRLIKSIEKTKNVRPDLYKLYCKKNKGEKWTHLKNLKKDT